MEVYEKIMKKCLFRVMLFCLFELSLILLIFILALSQSDSAAEGFSMVIMLFVIVSIAMIFVLMKVISSNKKAREYLENLPRDEYEKLAMEYENGIHINGTVLTDHFLAVKNAMVFYIIPISDIVWVYEAKQLIKLIYSVKTMYIVTDDKKTKSFNLGKYYKKPVMYEFFNKLERLKPNVFIGDTPENIGVFKNQFDDMVAKANSSKSDTKEIMDNFSIPERRNDSNNDDQYSQGNRFLGIIGAIGGSIIGIAIWVIVYQLGYIAGIAGIAMFSLTYGGYKKFGKKSDLFGIIFSVILSIIMLFISELICWVIMIYSEYSMYGYTIMDSIVAAPLLLQVPEIASEIVKDMLFGYLFMILGTFNKIKNLIAEVRLNNSSSI